MMSEARDSLALALRVLAERGFVFVGFFKGGGRRFNGVLRLTRGSVPVSVEISDWDFLEYPTIRVTDGLENFPKLRPHLDERGDLCYFARRSVVLDRYDPSIAIAQCLEQATAVLDKILNDARYVGADIQNELLVHWERQQPTALPIYMGTVRRDADHAPLHWLKNGGGAILADDHVAAAKLSAALNLGELEKTANRCWLFRSDALPPIPRQFPATVRSLFDWLRSWDQHVYNKIQRLLTTEAAYQYVCLGIGIHTPAGWIGVMFKPRMGKDLTPPASKALLHDRGAAVEVDRLSFTDVSPEFVHSRNLSFPDLSNKIITVVGCGAIGSQLAPALVRLGAGQGQQGLLRLVDEEFLGAENLGRHYLGYNKMWQMKALAVRDELVTQFPLSRVEAIPKSAQLDPMLLRSEILVDATGDESVSEYLNGLWLAGGRLCPVVYVWIRGNGECVQSLLTEGPGCACFRCMRLNASDFHRQDRFPVLKAPPTRKVLGCHAFTPYAISAPLQAAALAADVICDLVQGQPSPRFRTRQRENVDLLPVANGNPAPLADCPACGVR
jgi:hypothetical protein